MIWTPLHAIAQHTLQKRQFVVQGQALLLAFSGGQDSLCLLQILRDLQPKWNWRLAIAHCNHRWPPDAGANADYVQHLAQQWSLECYLETAPTILKGEAEGRIWRYQTLTTLAETHGFDVVLTAHTASDRAETLLYNLCRGSGSTGLHALQWQRPLSPQVQLVRPLLDITRQDIGQFCESLGLPVWNDSMNQDRHYRRNRLRLDCLPVLREALNPNLDNLLAQTAEILQAETDYLEQQAQHLLARATESQETTTFLTKSPHFLSALCQDPLIDAPLALQRRVMRTWLNQTLHYSPPFSHIEKVVALISGHNRDRSDPLLDKVVAEVQRPFLCLCALD
jgi:tRNA(Ile)-lysidine synthase